jgi:hypothetical protein
MSTCPNATYLPVSFLSLAGSSVRVTKNCAFVGAESAVDQKLPVYGNRDVTYL